MDQHPVTDIHTVGSTGHQGNVHDPPDAGDIHSCKEPLGIAELDNLPRNR